MAAQGLQTRLPRESYRVCSDSLSHDDDSLAGLDRKRVAVVVTFEGHECVFKGVAHYRQFPFSNDLRIEVVAETS